VRKPDKQIAERLWQAQMKASATDAVRLILSGNARVPKGTADLLIGLIEIGYKAGLDTGYDMAAEVFDPDPEEDEAIDEDAEPPKD
jgi:hypothetical protein